MSAIFAVSLRVAQALAALCCVILAFVTAAIIYDVTVRNLGMQPPSWTVSVTEYALLYVCMLGAPYMVRHKGHILVEALIQNVPPRAHKAMAMFAYLACVGMCLLLAWYGGKQTWESIAFKDMDYRSFDMPRWLMDITLPIGFGFSAIEFMRYAVGLDSLYNVAAQDKDAF
jgi:TRAP-type C4-dicarboxylate transport system permease small subunit